MRKRAEFESRRRRRRTGQNSCIHTQHLSIFDREQLEEHRRQASLQEQRDRANPGIYDPPRSETTTEDEDRREEEGSREEKEQNDEDELFVGAYSDTEPEPELPVLPRESPEAQDNNSQRRSLKRPRSNHYMDQFVRQRKYHRR